MLPQYQASLPGGLLAMQNLSAHPRPTEPESVFLTRSAGDFYVHSSLRNTLDKPFLMRLYLKTFCDIYKLSFSSQGRVAMQIRNPWMPKAGEVFSGDLWTPRSPSVNPGFHFLQSIISALQVTDATRRWVAMAQR